jgi:hypothetical protein
MESQMRKNKKQRIKKHLKIRTYLRRKINTEQHKIMWFCFKNEDIFTCGVQLAGLCWGEKPWLTGLPALGVPLIGVVGFEPPPHPPVDPTPNPAVRLPNKI